jgi:hypothetical protein
VPGTKDTDTALEAAEKCMMEDMIKEVLTNSESSRSGCATRPVGSRGGGRHSRSTSEAFSSHRISVFNSSYATQESSFLTDN